MILELKNSKYDVKVDSNTCITLSEIAFNKTKNENYLCNPKYFTSFIDTLFSSANKKAL